MVQIITITKLLNDNFHNKINQMFFFFCNFLSVSQIYTADRLRKLQSCFWLSRLEFVKEYYNLYHVDLVPLFIGKLLRKRTTIHLYIDCTIIEINICE